MENTYIGNRIHTLRKEQGLTQDQLADKLAITYQAVSKWENGVACPDIMMIPQIADIFHVSIDSLFREVSLEQPSLKREIDEEGFKDVGPILEHNNLVWENDETIRIVVCKGHELLEVAPDSVHDIEVTIEGPALNIYSQFSVSCEEVRGNINAGGDIECEGVGGNANAGGNISCEDVRGNLTAGGNVEAEDVNGSVTAGNNVSCEDVGNYVKAGNTVECEDIHGDASAGVSINCESIAGSVK